MRASWRVSATLQGETFPYPNQANQQLNRKLMNALVSKLQF